MALKDKMLDRAQKFIQKGYFDKAIAEYRGALELDPKDISIRLRMGDLYIKIGKKDVAIKEYTEAAKANNQRGFYLKAIAVWKQILKLEPTNLDVHVRLAELYTKQRLIADAISEYSFIVTVFERNGKTQETLELLKKMVDIDPENIGVRLKLADLFHRLTFKNDALAEYAWISDKLVSQGRREKAEKIYLGLVNSYPGDAEVLERLAGLYRAEGNGSEFYKYASRLFNIYKDSGDTENAKATCRSILEVNPDDAASLAYLSGIEGPSGGAPPSEGPGLELPLRVDSAADAKDISPATEPAVKAPSELVEEKPSEEIEISLEGFDEHVEEAAKEGGIEPPYAPAALKEDIASREITRDYDRAEVEGGEPQAGQAVGEKEVEFDLATGAVVSEVEQKAEAEPVSEPQPEQPVHVQEPSATIPEEIAPIEARVEETIEPEAMEGTSRPDTPTPDQISAASGAVEAAEPQDKSIEAVEPQHEAIETIEPEGPVESEEAQEDFSNAISELMEKTETEGAGPDAYNQKAEIIEEAPEETGEEGEKEEYVDLSAELGMEETVKDLAESWGKDESKDTFDEFKNGIGKQLNREDSETHYNLGIAYMEMELHGEAVKEFKVALKDAHLEFDCYTRLGLCYMALSNPDEAVLSYLKGLRVQGRSDEERRGMMYELALVYEATGKDDLAEQFFKSIYDVAPDYREVSKKVKGIRKETPFMPLDDGMIEVELL